MRYDLRVTRMGNLECEKSKQTGYSKLASLKVVLTTYREIACVIILLPLNVYLIFTIKVKIGNRVR